MGHEVVVADPNYAPMYASRSRKVKTDKRDARTLAEARGKRIAVVALARRLAGILYAMWRDNTRYDEKKLRMPRPLMKVG